jgi:hypothetical protein
MEHGTSVSASVTECRKEAFDLHELPQENGSDRHWQSTQLRPLSIRQRNRG